MGINHGVRLCLASTLFFSLLVVSLLFLRVEYMIGWNYERAFRACRLCV